MAKLRDEDPTYHYYAVTNVGRDKLKAGDLAEAIAEVKASKYYAKNAREIVKITRDVIWKNPDYKQSVFGGDFTRGA